MSNKKEIRCKQNHVVIPDNFGAGKSSPLRQNMESLIGTLCSTLCKQECRMLQTTEDQDAFMSILFSQARQLEKDSIAPSPLN